MQTKLTLRIDDALIKRAKSYSIKNGKSISQLVSDYFLLLNQKQKLSESDSLPPLTKKLKGILKTQRKISEKDYYQYLEDKYL